MTAIQPAYSRRIAVVLVFVFFVGPALFVGYQAVQTLRVLTTGRARARRVAAAGGHPAVAERQGRQRRRRPGLRCRLLRLEAVADRRRQRYRAGRGHPPRVAGVSLDSTIRQERAQRARRPRRNRRSSLAARAARCRVDRQHVSRTGAARGDSEPCISRHGLRGATGRRRSGSADERDDTRDASTTRHGLRPGAAAAEIEQSGFEVVTRDDRFIDRSGDEDVWWLIVARKP